MSQSGRYIPGTGAPPVETLTGDTGGPVSPDGAGNINIFGGSNINTAGTTNTITINLDDSVSVTGSLTAGTYVQAASPTTSVNGGYRLGSTVFMHNSAGDGNTFVGEDTGVFDTSPTNTTFNVGVGYQCLNSLVGTGANQGDNNTVVGAFSGVSITEGSSNTSVGYLSTTTLNTGVLNAAFGTRALSSLVSGSYNTALGVVQFSGVGAAYNGAQSSNLLICNTGNVLDNNIIRIGTTGSGLGEQNRCFIAGIQGVNLSSLDVVTNSGDQLGTATLTEGNNISLTTGVGTITIAANTESQVVNYTPINNASSPYTVLGTDYYIGADSSAGAITINLPNTTTTGRIFVVKDVAGTALTHNISLTTPGGVVTIDGITTYALNIAYQSVQILFNGASYEIY